MNLVERAQKLLLQPSQEWSVIATETHTVQGLFTNYVMVLAAIPVLAEFVGSSIIGYGGARVPLAYGISQLVAGYVLSLGTVFVLALVIDELAPLFEGQKNFAQAIKLSAFAPTAAWIAGAFKLIPWISILSILGLYSLYLLYVGLPKLMRVPEENAPGYIAATIVAAIVLFVVAGVLSGLAVPGRLRGF